MKLTIIGLALGAGALLFAAQASADVKSLSGYTLDTESTCGSYPKVSLKTSKDTCIGLVASAEDGLKRPRRILFVGDEQFIVTDMYGWVADKGIVWLFDAKDQSLKKIFENVDQAHGLGLGPDGLIYIGSRSSIFRFSLDDPVGTREIVINDLPVQGNHPLTHFIFNETGDLIVNVGAPSDQCLDEKKRPQYPCPESEGEYPEAVIRLYERSSNGQYLSYRVLARGLRNSMALAIEPTTGQLYQGENGMDFKDAGSPLEEINLIVEGAHYGWPYCYEDGKLNEKYKRSLFNRRVPKINCDSYQSPVAHLPAHSAPLDMMFYTGELFPEFQNKLMVSFHGYRDTGHRIVTLDLNNSFVPNGETKKEIVTSWSGESGLTPKGAPVGMTVDDKGRIWFVEDKNKTIMVLDRGSAGSGDLQGDQSSIELTVEQKNAFIELDQKVFAKSCVACHGGQFSGEPQEVVNALTRQNLVIPGDGMGSPLYQRLVGNEAGQRMPIGDEPVSVELTEKLKAFINSLK